ncbi:MAG: prepilin-type N-terminal cleavage/methylation domain-containing protein [Clostridia bacterium]|nr:prepilin-type N-terminal cleavage/methylation domain-containing protein [Clostridia bacterium]
MKKYLGTFNKSKKGFTLVELVVVIAIIAILAAIAIPAVISIINSADDTQVETDAAQMDSACKTYYMGVKSGAISRENFTPTLSGDVLPNKFVSSTKRSSSAKNCTVGGALEYAGMYNELIGKLESFGYDASGNIKAYGDNADGSLTQLSPDGKDTFTTLNYTN